MAAATTTDKVTFGSLKVGDKFQVFATSEVSIKTDKRKCCAEGNPDWTNSISPSLKVYKVEN